MEIILDLFDLMGAFFIWAAQGFRPSYGEVYERHGRRLRWIGAAVFISLVAILVIIVIFQTVGR
jgi:hypothetical protein